MRSLGPIVQRSLIGYRWVWPKLHSSDHRKASSHSATKTQSAMHWSNLWWLLWCPHRRSSQNYLWRHVLLENPQPPKISDGPLRGFCSKLRGLLSSDHQNTRPCHTVNTQCRCIALNSGDLSSDPLESSYDLKTPASRAKLNPFKSS